jgi:hypothetical protein
VTTPGTEPRELGAHVDGFGAPTFADVDELTGLWASAGYTPQGAWSRWIKPVAY